MGLLHITSESVTAGHPDKLCDQISDAILDAYLAQDPMARVAVETMASDNMLMIVGEITSSAEVNAASVARGVIRSVGYTDRASGLDSEKCLIVTNINEQSPDIAMGVDCGLEYKGQPDLEWQQMGAGDQGIMYGYACSETEDLMPLPIHLAHRLSRGLARVRERNLLPYLLPDGKSQVTVAYNEKGRPVAITAVVISAQHRDNIELKMLKRDIMETVIQPALPRELISERTKFYINPTGRFVIGGPRGDSGLTGRKLMVDTYGGLIRHGGGAFSGKDPSKVDRSGAYMARYVAKNLVAAGLADQCEIGVAYAIGMARPVSIYLNTYGTEKISLKELEVLMEKHFDFSVGAIIQGLNLRRPLYQAAATYGHFGGSYRNFPWESTLISTELRKEAGL
ncbi:methionine adenosyltransferase [Alkaliphilus crotonatoxidans]